jgi:site-specific recombinase XerC
VKDVRIAPNIYRTLNDAGEHVGWRVFVRGRDPKTGRSRLAPKRFKWSDLPCVCQPPRPNCDRCALAQLHHYRDAHKLEMKRLRRGGRPAPATPRAAGFKADAKTYLALDVVKAMPSYQAREVQIQIWCGIFEDLPRSAITSTLIDAKLQQLRNGGYSGSYVNKLRSALMSLWTRLDGRSAANPVRDTSLFDEAEMVARGHSYDLITRILDAVSLDRTRPQKGVKGSRVGVNASRARLEVLAWTGMDPSQLKRMTEHHVNIKERWYVTPLRDKGSKRRRTPRAVIRKPMSDEAAKAFERMIAGGLLGTTFSTDSLRHAWERAVARVEKQLQEELEQPAFKLPHIRLKDIRHSFGTKLFEETESLDLVGRMLDHAPGSPMTLRYALGAVPTVLQKHVGQFPGRRPDAKPMAKVLPANTTGRRKSSKKRTA